MPVARKIEDAASNATALWFTAGDWVPNNQQLPMILYRSAFPGQPRDPAAQCEQLFRHNGWPPEWRNGVYPFHHYHSTAHEVLGFAAGTARLLLGGPDGQEVDVTPGDCVLLPAGTGHRCLEASADFLVVGAYPPGQKWDLCRSALSAPEIAEMLTVPFPKSDPVLGTDGPLCSLWRRAGA